MEQMSVLSGVFVAAGGGPVLLACVICSSGEKNNRMLAPSFYIRRYADAPSARLAVRKLSLWNKLSKPASQSGTVGSPRRPPEVRATFPARCQEQLLRRRAGQYLPGPQTPPAGGADRNFTGFARN